MSYPGTLVGYVHYNYEGFPVVLREGCDEGEEEFFVDCHKDNPPFLCGPHLDKDVLRSNVSNDTGEPVYQIPIYVRAPQIGL